MTQDRHTHIELRELLAYTVCIIKRATLRTLRYDNDTTLLGFTNTTLHKLGQLVDIGRVFRNNSSLRTTCNSAVLCQEASITTHHLYKEDALVALSSITYTVYTFYNRIHGSIVTDGIVCTIKVIVNRSWKTNTADIKVARQIHSTSKRSVSADNNKCIDFFFLYGLKSFLTTFVSHELLRAGCLQNSSTRTNNTTYIFSCKSLDLVINQSVVSTKNSFYRIAIIDGRAGNGTNSRIHTWCVSTRCQYTNRFNLCHNQIPLFVVRYFMIIFIFY